MSNVFKKLNLKDQIEILILDAPGTFEAEISTLEGVNVRRDADAGGEVGFALAFVTSQDGLDAAAPAIAAVAPGDAVV